MDHACTEVLTGTPSLGVTRSRERTGTRTACVFGSVKGDCDCLKGRRHGRATGVTVSTRVNWDNSGQLRHELTQHAQVCIRASVVITTAGHFAGPT